MLVLIQKGGREQPACGAHQGGRQRLTDPRVPATEGPGDGIFPGPTKAFPLWLRLWSSQAGRRMSWETVLLKSGQNDFGCRPGTSATWCAGRQDGGEQGAGGWGVGLRSDVCEGSSQWPEEWAAPSPSGPEQAGLGGALGSRAGGGCGRCRGLGPSPSRPRFPAPLFLQQDKQAVLGLSGRAAAEDWPGQQDSPAFR